MAMSTDRRKYNREEVIAMLDDNFGIPDDGVNSDIEGLEDSDFEDIGDVLPAEQVAVAEHEDEDLNLRDIDIEETSDRQGGRPNNSTFADLEWSNTGNNDFVIPDFNKEVGPSRVMPEEATAVDFFQLFIDNRILCKIVRETNNYAQMNPYWQDMWKDIFQTSTLSVTKARERREDVQSVLTKKSSRELSTVVPRVMLDYVLFLVLGSTTSHKVIILAY